MGCTRKIIKLCFSACFLFTGISFLYNNSFIETKTRLEQGVFFIFIIIAIIGKSFELDDILNMTNGRDNVIILGDWNVVIGESTQNEHVGKYGLGKRNKRGQRLLEFCKEKT